MTARISLITRKTRGRRPRLQLFLLCLLWLIPSLSFAANPVLVGKSAPGAIVRVITPDGKIASETTADKRGAFRVQVPDKFHLEIHRDGYRTLRSSEVTLTADSGDVYQVDVPLGPGSPDDTESVVLRVEQLSAPEIRADTCPRTEGVRGTLPLLQQARHSLLRTQRPGHFGHGAPFELMK